MTFEWADGSDLGWSNWGDQQPRVNKAQICGVQTHEKEWATTRCGENRSYVCEYDTISERIAGESMPNHILSDDGKWGVSLDKKKIEKAEEYCNSHQGSLASIHNEEEKKAIDALV